jgi:uncharacterized membrane protein
MFTFYSVNITFVMLINYIVYAHFAQKFYIKKEAANLFNQFAASLSFIRLYLPLYLSSLYFPLTVGLCTH